MAYGQGARFDDTAWKYTSGGTWPAAGATVTVCTSVGTGIPCAPLATIYSDAALSQPITGNGSSFVTDSRGNYGFYAPGSTSYVITLTGAGLTGYTKTWVAPLIAGSNALLGVNTTKNLNAVRYVDPGNIAGWAGTTVDAWIAAAQTDLGVNGGTIRVATGAYTIAATITPASLVTIECFPGQQAILTASASLNAPLVHFNGVNHAGITGCKLDGNLSNNPNSNDLIRITNSSHINIDRDWLRNTLGNGIFLRTASAWIDITRNEIEHLGPALPSLGTAITSDNNAAAAIVHVKITENRIHDGSLGIYVQPAVSGTTTYDWEIAHNRIYAMSADGMAIFSTNSASVGQVIGLRFEDNDSECNGWPANGTGFDPFCVAGFRQAGATGSTSGSGLDLNSANMEGIKVVGNTLSHNFFEGLDVTPQTVTIVTTSNGALGGCASNCVQSTSGDPFNTNWLANQGVQIAGTNFLVASVQSTTVLTLSAAPGTQTGVTFIGVGIPNLSSGTAVVTGNTACDNGHGNAATSGQGFADIAYKVSYSSNFACRNNAPGFVSNKSSFISHNGDVSIGNNLSGASNGNFLSSTALNPSYYNVVTSGNAYGIVWDSQTNGAFASGPNIIGSTGAINNLGTGDGYEIGNSRFSQLTFNTAGSYQLNGGAGGGSFGAVLPALGTPGSPIGLTATIASGTFTLGTGAINSNTCAATVTVAGTGILATDAISWSFNADPNAITGYGAGATGTLSIWVFPTSGNANVRVCNLTGGAITPGAATLNWRVVR